LGFIKLYPNNNNNQNDDECGKVIAEFTAHTIFVITLSASRKIEIRPIGFVKRASSDENVGDKSLVSRIVLRKDLVEALNGIEEFSHVFIIYWMHKISNAERKLVHDEGMAPVGVFACRGPIRPNPIGLTLVELVKCEQNVLWVRGLDALDRTPVLDIKPYGRSSDIVVNFRAPKRFCKK
jgi:tRNA-Thr(GGU) m(6)t(6)A37 methyltransferase TsaA